MNTYNGVVFRPKFLKRIPKRLEPNFAEAAAKFNRLESSNAVKVLWCITCYSEDALNLLGLTTKRQKRNNVVNEQQTMTYISRGINEAFRNELRYQRTLIDKGFPHISIPNGCTLAFQLLNNSIGNDTVMMAIIIEACHYHLIWKTDEQIKNTINMLTNRNDCTSYDGICALNFSGVSADILLPHANYIGNLLSDMWENNGSLRKHLYQIPESEVPLDDDDLPFFVGEDYLDDDDLPFFMGNE
ncbi:MAG: hypothetical protein HFJ55_03740 [Clostridia bacterium]|nr:hypothetical protein [Clostridia bacterium]